MANELALPKSKKELGQYFTTNHIWLKPNVKEFILNSKCSIAYDPFAGSGELLNAVSELDFKQKEGLDIDGGLGWKYNDSLINIPKLENAIIITNPPYLTNYSAKRKDIWSSVKKYFFLSPYDDLYLIALDKMLNAQKYVVAIIPETFINSPFDKKRVYSINILEENPFNDTENPVCVVCFDGENGSLDKVRVYKNSHFATSLGKLEEMRLKPRNIYAIKFNFLKGKLALRAIDSTNPNKKIAFMRKEELEQDYNMAGIKRSSRLITVIDIPKLDDKKLNELIKICNKILNKYREDTDDILLSPFKGNMKNGIRRRRLDYETARAIIEFGLDVINGKKQRNLLEQVHS